MHCPFNYTYTIQKGDTLYEISKYYHSTVQMILAQNPGLNPYNLKVGSTIKVCPGSNYLMPGCSDSRNCVPIRPMPDGTVCPIKPEPPVTVRPIKPLPPVSNMVMEEEEITENTGRYGDMGMPQNPGIPESMRMPRNRGTSNNMGIPPNRQVCPLNQNTMPQNIQPSPLSQNTPQDMQSQLNWNSMPRCMACPVSQNNMQTPPMNQNIMPQNMQISQPKWETMPQNMQISQPDWDTMPQSMHMPQMDNIFPNHQSSVKGVLNEKNWISAMDTSESFGEDSALEMNEKYLNLNNSMRHGWIEHVYGIRMLILSIIEDLADKEAVTGWIMENPDTIAGIYADYYSEEISEKLKDLLTELVKTATDLFKAYKDQDKEKIEELSSGWFDNADQLAEQLSSINPNAELETMRRMLYALLQLAKQEIEMRLAGDYDEDILAFDSVEQEAMEMAEYLVNALVMQFPDKF